VRATVLTRGKCPTSFALRGDASDRILGATGVGAITAASILRTYGSLQKALAAGCFASEAVKLRLYRAIATMDKKAPLPALRNLRPTWGRAAKLARDWQLNRLAERLDAVT
jgi:DNA polymerase-1